MKTTIIAVGNGGYNLASDIIKANIFPDSKFIVCDTDERNLEESSKNADETFLLDKIHANTSFLMMNQCFCRSSKNIS